MILIAILVRQLVSNSLHLLGLVHARSGRVRAVRDLPRCIPFAIFLLGRFGNTLLISVLDEVLSTDANIAYRRTGSDIVLI